MYQSITKVEPVPVQIRNSTAAVQQKVREEVYSTQQCEEEIKKYYRDNVQVNLKEMNGQLGRIFTDLKRIQPVRDLIYAGRGLDLMFIMDCTGSMEPWIEKCKIEIAAIISYIQNQFYKINIRVSIVAYRDYYHGDLDKL